MAIRKPINGGSYYYNYKNFHSVVLMALVDGDYKFTWVEVGANGTSSDAQIFEDCGIKQAIDQHVIGFPTADDDRDIPYVCVGDDAFPLRTYTMKPFGRLGLEVPERIYNYRTSQCRRVSENAFGILANRYACLLSVIKFQPKIASDIVLPAICCHNLMCSALMATEKARQGNSGRSTWSITITMQPEQCHGKLTWYSEHIVQGPSHRQQILLKWVLQLKLSDINALIN